MSEALARTVTVNVILPVDKLVIPGEPQPVYTVYPTPYLLHDVFGNHIGWVSGTRIQRWAEEKGLAVVMSAGENAFYLDHAGMRANYGDFVGCELPEVMRRKFLLSPRREDTFVAGLSMGRLGALRNCLKYHETFGRVGAFSAALVLEGIEKRTTDSPMFIERRDYTEAVFGNLDTIHDDGRDPLWSAKQLSTTGDLPELPELYLACGTKDSLYEPNVRFRDTVEELGFKVTWDEVPFAHEWDFWDLEVKRFIDWLQLGSAEAGVNS